MLADGDVAFADDITFEAPRKIENGRGHGFHLIGLAIAAQIDKFTDPFPSPGSPVHGRWSFFSFSNGARKKIIFTAEDPPPGCSPWWIENAGLTKVMRISPSVTKKTSGVASTARDELLNVGFEAQPATGVLERHQIEPAVQ
jgi:hypothetical protein